MIVLVVRCDFEVTNNESEYEAFNFWHYASKGYGSPSVGSYRDANYSTLTSLRK